MSKRAVEWSERFSWRNTAGRFIELYEGVVAASAG
jgi:hypothetical protein